MTSHDYVMTMKKSRERTVRVAELKARLSEYLRAARKGLEVTVYDRETPVARIVPVDTPAGALGVRQPSRGLHDVRFPAPIKRPIDSLAALLEERQASR